MKRSFLAEYFDNMDCLDESIEQPTPKPLESLTALAGITSHLEVYKNLYDQEYKHRIEKYGISVIPKQSRKSLVDWMLLIGDVAESDLEAFFYAVRYMDKYISLMDSPIDRDTIVRLAVICMILGDKFCDGENGTSVYFPTFGTSMTKKQILDLEVHTVNVLEWNFNHPTTLDFAGYYIPVALKYVPLLRDKEKTFRHMVDLILSLCNYSYEMSVEINPSLCAAAGVLYSIYAITGFIQWPKEMETISAYNINTIILHCDTIYYLNGSMTSRRYKNIFEIFSGNDHGDITHRHPMPSTLPSMEAKTMGVIKNTSIKVSAE